MSFWNLKIHNIQKDSASLSVTCSKGSYLRSWVHYLGQRIKTGACLAGLTRLSSGAFDIQNSLTIKGLKEKLANKFPSTEEELKFLLKDSFLFPREALTQFPEVELTERNAKLLKQGQIPLYISQTCQKTQIAVNKQGQAQILKAVRGHKLTALLEIRPFEKIRILRNFPQQIF